MNQLTYHYLVMTQKDLLENQCFEEILREKTTYYFNRKKERDFWLLISPKFIYSPEIFKKMKQSHFYNQKKGTISSRSNFFTVLISLDKEFINWISLRLGYFENIDKNQYLEDLKTKSFVSDGIRGTILFQEEETNPLDSYFNYIHPEILTKKNSKFLDLYYQVFNQNLLKN